MQSLNGAEVRTTSRRGEYQLCCPYCAERGKSPDENFHLGFNTLKKRYHCFRCEASGRLDELGTRLALVESDHDRSYMGLQSQLDSIRTHYPDYADTDPLVGLVDLTAFSQPLTDDTPFAMDYMLSRGFTMSEIKQHKVRVGTIGMWQGRIVFPFFDAGRPVYAIGRTYIDQEPKYYNTCGKKSLLVYGIDQADGCAIICEGVISAIAAHRTTGLPAVALMGKSISRFQAAKILNKCRTVWLSLDGDVSDEEKTQAIKTLRRAGDFTIWNVSLPFKKDPDDLRQDYLTYFHRAKREGLL